MFESKGRDGLTALLSQEKPSHSRGECLPDPSLDTSLKSGGADDHAEATQTPCKRKIDQCDPDTPTLAQPKRLRGKQTVSVEISDPVRLKLQKAVECFGVAEQGNPLGKDYRQQKASVCEICGVARHSVLWCTRLTGSGCQRTVGSQCFFCYRATQKLGVTRSKMILHAVPEALLLVKSKSVEIRSRMEMQDLAKCRCCECDGGKK